MTSPAQSSTWLRPVLILVASALVGMFVLPLVGGSVAPPNALVGQPAPDFSLPILHGGSKTSRILLSALKGKLVVLDFWASWCKPCTVQSNILKAYIQSHPEGSVVFVGVNTADDPRRAVQYAADHELPYSVVLDTDAVADQYGAFTLPTIVVIDATGTVSHFSSRLMDESDLHDALETAARPRLTMDN